MVKKLAVSELSGTIFDAAMSKKPGVMTDNKVNRTEECVTAVAEHMKFKADNNEQRKGFFQYEWEGIGTLTWQSESEAKKKRCKEYIGEACADGSCLNINTDVDAIESCDKCPYYKGCEDCVWSGTEYCTTERKGE